jgi:hypothetical protein
LICSITTGKTSMSRSIEPPHEIVERRWPAAVGHVHHPGAGLLHEQLDGEIVERRGTGRAEGELARPRHGIVDELLHRVHRRLVVDDHGGGVFGRAGDRDGVAQRVKGRVHLHGIAEDDHPHGADQQRVAVGLGLEHLAHADHAVAAGLVLDNDGLVELRAQAFRDQPRGEVRDAGRRGRDDQSDLARGEGLRRSGSREQHVKSKAQ